jgi:hypothetical protein
MPYVPGKRVHGVVHVKDLYYSPNVYANNVNIALWEEAADTAAFIASLQKPEVVFVIETVEGDGVTPANASAKQSVSESQTALGVSSGIIPQDSPIRPGAAPPSAPVSAPAGTDASVAAASTPGVVDNKPAASVASVNVGGDFSQFNQDNIPYDTLMLTAKTSLADFTKKAALWGNQPTPFGPNAAYVVKVSKGDNKFIKAQSGLTVPQILSNMSNLAANIWEPLKQKFPGAIITNTFRQNPPGGSMSQSQHGTGQAMDIQVPGFGPAQYFEMAKWCRDNLPINQLLQERAGRTIWIHVAHHSGTGINVPKQSAVANLDLNIRKPGNQFIPGLFQYT